MTRRIIVAWFAVLVVTPHLGCATQCDIYCDSLYACTEKAALAETGSPSSRDIDAFDACADQCDSDQKSNTLSKDQIRCVIDASGDCNTLDANCGASAPHY